MTKCVRMSIEDKQNAQGENQYPLVSAVVITHNRKELLKKAIASVMSQTWPRMECVIVDDASTDGTDAYVSSWMTEQDSSDKIQFIRIQKEQSRGGNHARNKGAQAAKGDYLAFLDDDDQWLPEKTEKQIRLLQKENTSICYCPVIKTDPEGTIVSVDDPVNLARGDLSRRILQGVVCTTSSMIIQRDAFFSCGQFDETLPYWQEYDFCIRAFQNNRVSALEENAVIYLVNKKDPARLTNHLENWEKFLPSFLEKHQDLLSKLTESEKKQFDLFVNSDALRRAHFSGNRKKLRKYLKKRFLLTERPKDYLKWVLNYDRHFDS